MSDMGTVGELLDWLSAQPRAMPVILAKGTPSEGYSPWADAGQLMYVEETSYSGRIYPIPEDVTELVSEGRWSAENVVPDQAARVVVLGPVS